MDARYIAESHLRVIVLKKVRSVAPSCIGLCLQPLPGPFRPRNWRIGKLDVLAHDYGAARDRADELEAESTWICVPDGHALDGQVFGREQKREPG